MTTLPPAVDMRPAALPSALPPPARLVGRPRFQRARVIAALMLREMGAKFGRSSGGYLWAIAEPVGGILLLSVLFSLALRKPPLGDSFILFYASGIVPFSMFRVVAQQVSNAISSNRGLLTYPVVSTLDAVFAKFLLAFMTNCMSAIVLFTGIVLGWGLHVTFSFGALIAGLTLAALLGLGVGTMNCVLFGFFPTWKNLWSVLTRPLMIMSGVLYLYESVPTRFQPFLWWNPLVHVVALTREGIYGVYHPLFISPLYVLGLAGGLFLIGAYLVRRHASFLIEQ